MHHLRKASTLRTRSLWVFGKAKWLVGVILALLGTLGTLLGVPALNTQLRTDLPGLRCWAPVPMDNSKFTVAMSPFITVNEGGRVRTTRDGRELARLLYARLEASFESLDLDVPYELRGPDAGCPVVGANRDDRAAAAEQWANTINADVVIYGAILEGEAGTELQSEFFVAYRGFTDAADLVGPHELGRPLRVDVPVQANALEGVADHPVNARAQALSLIALGLASYAVDDYEQALDHFIAADEVANWPESAGKEMLYVLMGNTASQLAATTLDSAFVDEALDYYDRALAINPDLARALLDEAVALYQLALGDLETRQGSQVDLEVLAEAEELFVQAAATDSPEAAEIELKMHFGLGQIYLIRHYLQVEGDDWLARARAEFQTMIDSFATASDQRPVRNRTIIGHAYARLALIASQLDQQPDEAIPLYKEAIALVSPRWQAQYWIDLGDIYAGREDAEAARNAYMEARSLAELYSYPTLLERAEDKLDALP